MVERRFPIVGSTALDRLACEGNHRLCLYGFERVPERCRSHPSSVALLHSVRVVGTGLLERLLGQGAHFPRHGG